MERGSYILILEHQNIKSYQFPVLHQALITVQDVVNATSVAFERDLPPFLTARTTRALTGRKHHVLFPPLLVLHHSDRHKDGKRLMQSSDGETGLVLELQVDTYRFRTQVITEYDPHITMAS